MDTKTSEKAFQQIAQENDIQAVRSLECLVDFLDILIQMDCIQNTYKNKREFGEIMVNDND